MTHDHDRVRQAGHHRRRRPAHRVDVAPRQPDETTPTATRRRRSSGTRPPTCSRMYAEEDAILKTKEPFRDKRTGKVAVAIDKAIEIVAKKGLPHREAGQAPAPRPGISLLGKGPGLSGHALIGQGSIP